MNDSGLNIEYSHESMTLLMLSSSRRGSSPPPLAPLTESSEKKTGFPLYNIHCWNAISGWFSMVFGNSATLCFCRHMSQEKFLLFHEMWAQLNLNIDNFSILFSNLRHKENNFRGTPQKAKNYPSRYTSRIKILHPDLPTGHKSRQAIVVDTPRRCGRNECRRGSVLGG